MVFESHNQQVADKSTLYFLTKERKRIQSQIDNFLAAIGNGLSTMSTKLKLEQLEQELAQNEIKITAEESKARVTISKEEVKKFVLTNIEKEPKQMINTLISKIVLYDDKIEIHYNYTNKKGPDGERQDFLFIRRKLNILQPITNTKKIMMPIEVEVYF